MAASRQKSGILHDLHAHFGEQQHINYCVQPLLLGDGEGRIFLPVYSILRFKKFSDFLKWKLTYTILISMDTTYVQASIDTFHRPDPILYYFVFDLHIIPRQS